MPRTTRSGAAGVTLTIDSKQIRRMIVEKGDIVIEEVFNALESPASKAREVWRKKTRGRRGLRTVSKFLRVSRDKIPKNKPRTVQLRLEASAKIGRSNGAKLNIPGIDAPIRTWNSIFYMSEFGETPSGSDVITAKRGTLMAIPLDENLRGISPKSFQGVWIPHPRDKDKALFKATGHQRASGSKPARTKGMSFKTRTRSARGGDIERSGKILYLGVKSVPVRYTKGGSNGLRMYSDAVEAAYGRINTTLANHFQQKFGVKVRAKDPSPSQIHQLVERAKQEFM